MTSLFDDAHAKIDAWHLGKTSARHESGNNGAGAISSGKGDKGGISYGTYQLSYNEGTLREYLDQSLYAKSFDGLVPATREFNAKWRELAISEPGFAADQHDFIKSSHYDKENERLQAAGLDLSGRGRAVHDALWSTSVQYRGLTKSVFSKGLHDKFGEGYDLSKLADRDIVEAVQDYKLTHNNALFRSSPGSWPGLIRRAREEKVELVQLADSEAVLALSGQYRDWRLGPPPSQHDLIDPMEHFRDALKHLSGGSFVAPGAYELPKGRQVDHQSPQAQHDALSDGVLRQNERGPAVTALQQSLNLLGGTNKDGHSLKADGLYGRSTQEAVENFQLWSGLPTTGIADRATLDAVRVQAGFAAARQAMGQPPGPHLVDNLTATGPIDLRDAADLNQYEANRARATPTTPAPAVSPPEPNRAPGPRESGTLNLGPAIPALQHPHLRDFRDPTHPDHSVYAELRERLPDACENRLLQLTAACHVSGIEPGQLGEIRVRDDAVLMVATWPPGARTQVDITIASPTPQETMRQMELHDQQQALQLAQFQTQQQQVSAQAQQGPSMIA